MLKRFIERTDNVTSRVASIGINLAVIGVSAVVIAGVIDRFFGKKIRASIAKRALKKAKVVGPDAPKKTEPAPAPKKPVTKKKVTKSAGVSKPEDLPMPNAESQE